MLGWLENKISGGKKRDGSGTGKERYVTLCASVGVGFFDSKFGSSVG